MRSFQSGLGAPALAAAMLVAGIAFQHQAHAAVDVSAAESLAKSSGCTKCHAPEKKKDGPAYRDVAANFKGDPEAFKKVHYHITSGEKVKFDDGHEEDHKKVKSKDEAEIKNLIEWILSLEGGSKYTPNHH
jgi:cytochrome c